MTKPAATKRIEICPTPFDPATELAAFTKAHSAAGAITSFLGQVRSEAGQVNRLYLESYPSVTEKGIDATAKQALKRWPLEGVLILHRIGEMGVGDPIVLVATAAKHRRCAFESCDFLMDYLKTEAVFWKKQYSKDGIEWIEPRPEDYTDNERWSKKWPKKAKA